MASIAATWTKIAASEQLQRSSHNVTAVGDSIYIFGGELKPREPRDNDLHKIDIKDSTKATVQSLKASSAAPSPRVGSATARIGDKIYFFSGRGGVAMAPVDEQGSLWSLDTNANTWEQVKPSSSTFPEARSYHCMASDGKDTIYMHAGCPEKGRLGDLWSFTLTDRTWKQLKSAPDPPRGGTSIAFADGKVYRMNGFDGQTEQGGSLDVYEPTSDSWSTLSYAPDGKTGPGARSVAALVPVKFNGKMSLVTLFGESDPSSLGHQGAGKMLSDIWSFSLQKGAWSPVTADSVDGAPDARGWFDADLVSLGGKDSIAVSGGLGESNERLNDLWVLSF